MPQIGGTTEEMQSFAQTFSRESAAVQQLSGAINGQVGQTWWIGPAADRFRSQWESEFLPVLNQLETALQECSTSVQQHMEGLQQVGG